MIQEKKKLLERSPIGNGYFFFLQSHQFDFFLWLLFVLIFYFTMPIHWHTKPLVLISSLSSYTIDIQFILYIIDILENGFLLFLLDERSDTPHPCTYSVYHLTIVCVFVRIFLAKKHISVTTQIKETINKKKKKEIWKFLERNFFFIYVLLAASLLKKFQSSKARPMRVQSMLNISLISLEILKISACRKWKLN